MKTATIPLKNGGFALVDEQDVELLLKYSWYKVVSRRTHYVKTGKNTRMHRLLLQTTDSKKIVDHINGNGLDNRRENLRVVDVATNVANRQKSRSGNKCPGVYFERGKWRAEVTVNYKTINLGRFFDELEAINKVNLYRISIGRPPVVL